MPEQATLMAPIEQGTEHLRAEEPVAAAPAAHQGMQVTMVAIGALRGYDANPRKNDKVVPKMCDAIKEFGFRVPILAQRDGTIIDGHLRMKAAATLKMREVPVIYTDGLSEAQVRAFRLLVNRSVEWADWDEDKLREEIAALIADSYDISMTGFDPKELDRLIEANEEDAQRGDPEEVPEIVEEVEPVTRRGDIWRLGAHRLMCGDSTSESDMRALMGGEMADLWLTDPPYNVAYEGKTKDALTIQNDSMDDAEFRQFLVNVYRVANGVMKPGAVFYIWHADSEGYNFRGAAFDVGWQVRQCLIWMKNTMVLGRQDYQWKHESCLYGWKSGAGHKWNSDRKQTTILEYDKPSRNGEHPTMKPVALFEYQMGNSSSPNDVVLDSFGGSGTTIMAAERIQRRARLMELDPRYCDVIVKRWEKYTGKKAELVVE